jgi:hypothetical protein
MPTLTEATKLLNASVRSMELLQQLIGELAKRGENVARLRDLLGQFHESQLNLVAEHERLKNKTDGRAKE